MRRYVWLIAALFLLAGTALAEDKPNPDQLKKAYEDTLAQLKEAQNSKNDLAKENEKLGKQLEDVKKQLAGAQGQIENLKRDISDNDQKTFYLRSYQAAWENFMRAHPDLIVRWKLFLGDDVLAVPQERQPLFDPNWPLLDGPRESARG
jgi:septal ring factor EnvC (AmiA/AmiB activator)